MTRLPATPPPGRKRKSRPLRVELRAALRVAGFDPDNVEWHHSPPLSQRPFDPIANDYDPPENDDRYLIPMWKKEHRERTAKIDAPDIAKTRRVGKKQAKHASRIRDKGDLWPYTNEDARSLHEFAQPEGFASNYGRNRVDARGFESGPPRKHKDIPSKWPKGRKIQSRPFSRAMSRLARRDPG